MRPLPFVTALVALGALVPLGACSKSETAPTATASDANRTLAAAISGAPGLTNVSTALSESGLADVFDGPGSYTVLAPDDDAFAKLSQGGTVLTDPAHRAELVAILRGHILPGHLTPDAIRHAIAEKKGPVSMRTLADGMVTFTADGNVLTATGPDGAKATVAGDPLVASNGVVLPIDGLLKTANTEKAS